uniref:Uncharacterized protein n=1 Tax=Pararge aegeria TaxID=116150 RepID=S4PTG9_9NEOP
MFEALLCGATCLRVRRSGRAAFASLELESLSSGPKEPPKQSSKCEVKILTLSPFTTRSKGRTTLFPFYIPYLKVA